MSGEIMGFIIWCIVGLIFIVLGVISFFSKKPTGFWANVDMFQVTDTKQYNHAMGKLFFVFGIVFIVFGLPLLTGQNSAWILLSMLGVVGETIITMVIYITRIEKKYKKK